MGLLDQAQRDAINRGEPITDADAGFASMGEAIFFDDPTFLILELASWMANNPRIVTFTPSGKTPAPPDRRPCRCCLVVNEAFKPSRHLDNCLVRKAYAFVARVTARERDQHGLEQALADLQVDDVRDAVEAGGGGRLRRVQVQYLGRTIDARRQ